MADIRRFEFDQKAAVHDILTALEYGSRKEERDILRPILHVHGLEPVAKKRLCEAITRAPGFESFFIDVVRAVRPFSQMLADVYTFLSSSKTVANRRASQFLINFEEAKKKLKFDLDSFPKELLKMLNEVERFGSVVELSFPGVNLDSMVPHWDGTEADALWKAVSPHWDGDFYDDGFHRALSYAHTVMVRGDHTQNERVAEIAVPILDRLSACCELVNSQRPLFGERIAIYMGGPATELTMEPVAARFHIMSNGSSASSLTQLVQQRYANVPQTVLDVLGGAFRGFAISVNFWEHARFQREDRSDWLKQRTGYSPSEISPDSYLDLLEDLATAYRHTLDQVLPIVGEFSYKTVLTRLLEFVTLPFWKHRWYLYELWTLVRVLRVAQRKWNVELNVTEDDPLSRVLEWNLPGGSAKQPVATIGDLPDQICCWAQRKTYHPGTGAGLEPDLRFMRSNPEYQDVLIIENKDRVTARGSDLGEILDRYVGGTCAESVWLVNYEKFPEPADQAAQIDDHRLEILLELGPDVFSNVVELAPQRAQLAFDGLRGGRVRALDLRTLLHHRVVPDLLLLGLRQGAAQLKLRNLGFLLEVDEQAQSPQAARRARLDGEDNALHRLARRHVLHRRRVLGEFGETFRLREVHVCDDEALHGMRSLGEFKADFFDCSHLLRRCGGTHAVRGRQRPEGSLGLGILSRHHDGTDGELLPPRKRTLDSVGEQASRRRALHHGRRHAVDALGGTFRALGCGRLHARQTGVDAFDGLVSFVHLDGDDQFEFVIGHGDSTARGPAFRVRLRGSTSRRTHPRECHQGRDVCPA